MAPLMREKYLAIVLLDIIGSTKFVQRHGAVKSASWFQYHDQLARSLCYKHQGREIDRSDGFLLSFDRLSDAVAFALKYQETIPPKTKLKCRIGIHWGKVIEVEQDAKFVGAGAKRVELEGLAKNIAARTMSLCQADQVLMTAEASRMLKSRLDSNVPREARIECVGLYRFKGVRKPQEIYAIGTTTESLQPPMGSEKVKRLGGPKYIKARARDRRFKEWVEWFFWRVGLILLTWVVYMNAHILFNQDKRWVLNLPYYIPVLDDLGMLISWVLASLVDLYS